MEPSETFFVYRTGGVNAANGSFPNLETAEQWAVENWAGEDLTIVKVTSIPVRSVTGTVQVTCKDI